MEYGVEWVRPAEVGVRPAEVGVRPVEVGVHPVEKQAKVKNHRSQFHHQWNYIKKAKMEVRLGKQNW